MARKIAVEIVGDASSLERSFLRARKSTQNFNRDITTVGRTTGKNAQSFKGFGSSVLGVNAALIGTTGVAVGVKAAFDEMAAAQKVAAQTAAVIESTGAAANVTARHVDELASSLLKKSGVDDEVIASGENVLLTFVKIRNEVGKGNDVFDQATRATLDLSVALGKDMQSSAILVGKTLNDPVKGLTALTRAGVQFDEGQRKQIKSLVAAGRTMDAQKVILAELNREFGKSAEAAGKTLPGQLAILRESLRNTGGSIAQDLVPSLELALGLTNKLVGAMNTLEGKSVKGRLGHFGFLVGSIPLEAIKEAADSVKGLAGAFGLLKKNTQGLQGPVGKPELSLPPGLQGLLTPEMLPDAVKRTADQRNQWWDAMIGRKLDRVQDVRTLQGQLVSLRAIAALIKQRLAVTKDITRQLTLEDTLLSVTRQEAGVREQQQAVREQLAEQAAAAAQAARDEALAWADFAVEKAAATKGLKDDLKAAQDRLKLLEKQAGVGKKTAAEARSIWEQQQEINRIRKEMGRAEKGFATRFKPMNVSSFIQSIGLGLSVQQMRKLAVALSQLGPGGTLPVGHSAAFAGAGGVTVNGDVHISGVQNVKQMEAELHKRARRRAHGRRGN